MFLIATNLLKFIETAILVVDYDARSCLTSRFCYFARFPEVNIVLGNQNQ
jgi:hypothetical protein